MQLPVVTWSVFIVLCVSKFSAAVTSLHRMNVKKDLVTMSGHSAGGSMAQTMFVSYSSRIKGIATLSHTFYRCGPGILPDANSTLQPDDLFDMSCTNLFNPLVSELYDPNDAIADILSYFQLGLIDDPKNMEGKPLYVFSGSMSYLFPLQMGLGPAQVFQPFIKNKDMIKVAVFPANLTLPSNKPGLPSCSGPLDALQIANCGFSAAFESLQWILGKKYVRAPAKVLKLQPLLEFDQTEFFYGFGENVFDDDPVMDSIGYYYIPKACRIYGHKCLLHFYFHGCMTSRDVVGPNHVLNSGFLEVAETNGIIMIFPQTRQSLLSSLRCWDVYGYTGDFFATQLGAQVTVIKNMMDRLMGPNDPYDNKPAPTSEAESDYYTTTSKPLRNLKVSPELLRAYEDDDENVLKNPAPYHDVSRTNRHCTLTRVSPDTVLKRCRPAEV